MEAFNGFSNRPFVLCLSCCENETYEVLQSTEAGFFLLLINILWLDDMSIPYFFREGRITIVFVCVGVGCGDMLIGSGYSIYRLAPTFC